MQLRLKTPCLTLDFGGFVLRLHHDWIQRSNSVILKTPDEINQTFMIRWPTPNNPWWDDRGPTTYDEMTDDRQIMMGWPTTEMTEISWWDDRRQICYLGTWPTAEISWWDDRKPADDGRSQSIFGEMTGDLINFRKNGGDDRRSQKLQFSFMRKKTTSYKKHFPVNSGKNHFLVNSRKNHSLRHGIYKICETA